MAHEIETNKITGKAEIAFVGQTPWHGLGQELTADASIDTWSVEAGLNWEALIAPAVYTPAHTQLQLNSGRNVIYRSDNYESLGVMTGRYKIHQPTEILDFFNTLVQSAGFKLEVAGCLRGGKRIWALANVNKEACVLHDDMVKGYLLLSTSFDGSTATIGQFTSVRVVCNNTISMADNEKNVGRVKLTHGSYFDASLLRDELGIAVSGFEGMMDDFRFLARKSVKKAQVDKFLKQIFPMVQNPFKSGEMKESKGYKAVLELFDGRGRGSDLPGVSGTKWGLLNAVTEYVDHEAGRESDSRLANAWFGDGNRLKSHAKELLMA